MEIYSHFRKNKEEEMIKLAIKVGMIAGGSVGLTIGFFTFIWMLSIVFN